MADLYEEIIDQMPVLRLPMSERHERICRRLYGRVAAALDPDSPARVLPIRTAVRVARDTVLRPDLTVVMQANDRLWLAAEVIQAGDHQADTVMKKAVYEDLRIPRLWMLDPRYDNIEVYHATSYGLMLKGILAGSDILTDNALIDFAPTIAELFAD